MPIARQSSFAKLSSGGGRSYSVPPAWMQSLLGPGQPIQPVAPPRDTEIPRQIDFPISVNANLTPRSGYGLMPFQELSFAYEKIPECRAPVLLIDRQLSAFVPHLQDKKGNVVYDHPYQWMCEEPDGYTPFHVWLTRYIKSAKIFDAPALYFERSGNTIKGMHFIDGSTLFVILDSYGRTPRSERVEDYVRRASNEKSTSVTHLVPGAAPGPTSMQQFVEQYNQRYYDGLPVPEIMPAYAQVIKGTPFAWWAADDIWYNPQSPRVNAPYGEPFIEAAWPWVMVVANLIAFELGHYRTGNMPEGMITLPRDWLANPDQLEALELAFNQRMTSNPATERNRIRFFPDGSKWTETKRAEWPESLYTRANGNILNAIGVTTAEFGDIPSKGLGGAGFKEGQQSDLNRNLLNPNRNLLAAPFNYVLRKNGVDDVVWVLDYPMQELDPDKLKTSLFEGMARGAYSLNEVRAQLTLSPVGDPNDENNVANKHLIIAGANMFVIEDVKETDGVIGAPPPNQAGGPPVGPDGGLEHTPEDAEVAEKMVMTGHVGPAKYYSIAKAVSTGLKEEREEHPEMPESIIAQLVDDHLKEDPDYYEPKLQSSKTQVGYVNVASKSTEQCHACVHFLGPNRCEKVAGEISPNGWCQLFASMFSKLEKHCGVCPEDDLYFGAPISREATVIFPKDHHANDVEIVAAVPAGLEPKAFLWKPEGGEVTDLQAWIGGPQYVREEAAYLIDRSLGFMLVPVAYVADSYGEKGAAIYYTSGIRDALGPSGYGLEWIEKAGVFDHIISQRDRGFKHNYGTHPDDPQRMILFDNGLCLPELGEAKSYSPFSELISGKELTESTLVALERCYVDDALWQDVEKLVGKMAVETCRSLISGAIENKCCNAKNYWASSESLKNYNPNHADDGKFATGPGGGGGGGNTPTQGENEAPPVFHTPNRGAKNIQDNAGQHPKDAEPLPPKDFKGNNAIDKIPHGAIGDADEPTNPASGPKKDPQADIPTEKDKVAKNEINAPDHVSGLDKIEAQLQDVKGGVEHGAIYAKDGKLIEGKIGSSDYGGGVVEWSPSVLESARGGTLTHSHPGGSPLSAPDVAIAVSYGLNMRAVGTREDGSKVAWGIEPPAGYEGKADHKATFKEVTDKYNKHYTEQQDKLWPKVESGEWTDKQWATQVKKNAAELTAAEYGFKASE